MKGKGKGKRRGSPSGPLRQSDWQREERRGRNEGGLKTSGCPGLPTATATADVNNRTGPNKARVWTKLYSMEDECGEE